MSFVIESNQNKLVKEIVSLKQRSKREAKGLYILEGERLVSEIPDERIVKYYALSEDFAKGHSFERKNAYIIKNEIFKSLCDTVNSQGILAVCQIEEESIEKAFEKPNPFFVILERVMDPGNLGTIIRTCDAAGVDSVFLSKGCVDLYNPKVVRATMGSIFHLPIYRNVDAVAIVERCNTLDITTMAAHLKASKSIYEVDMKKPCAIIIGNEANGLSDEITELAREPVIIPMPGNSESMNASMAAGIMIYEGVRQRLEK